jgi:hypothetical protein
MDMEFIKILEEKNIKVNGLMVSDKGEGIFLQFMEIYMKDSLETI